VTSAPVAVAAAGADVSGLARALAGAPFVALDVESDGMFAYRARVCLVQLAGADRIGIVDALATPIAPLAALLGERGPTKIVHDVAFDARILAEAGVDLGNVRDTAVAARFLGRTATGLASLVASELGAQLDKRLQHHDWRVRPLLQEHIDYLARDVLYLEALADKLWAELGAREIEEEVLEETRYRIANAIAAARDEDGRPPAYTAAKGAGRLAPVERAIFRHLWRARDDEGARLDMPPARMVATDALLAIARARPRDAAALARVRLPRDRGAALEGPFLAAVARGVVEGDVPEGERAHFLRPTPPREVVAQLRAREAALTRWRKEEAKTRGVDEQVILPGHCMKDLAEAGAMEVGNVTAVPGFGACRARYAEAIVLVLARAERSSEGG